MSWASADEIFLSTSLASYLDRHIHIRYMHGGTYPKGQIHLAQRFGPKLDGRKLLGVLRSFDQFANAVLDGACERIMVGDLYCGIPLGLYVIRGENVVFIGELDLEEELPAHMTQVSALKIKSAQKAERDAKDLKGSMRRRMEFLDLD